MSIEPGSRFGPYEVLSHLGAGGMGEVFRARDPRLHRDVALKVIGPARAMDLDSIARFEREARAAAALNHPHIVSIFDVGTQDGSPFIVSELLDGVSLRELMVGQISERRAIEWGAQIADALATAHAKGIIHRDLKPENLFVISDDRIKVLDFGLAKLLETAPSQVDTVADALRTESGMVLGTAPYMSPEQVTSGPVDSRSDIFSLGVVLYEMLTGHHVFKRATPMETMSAILKDDVAAPSSLTPSLSPAVERIVLRCLEKTPARRFQSASDLGFALTSAAVGSGSQPPVSIPHPYAFGRRSRAVSVTAAGLAILTLGVFVGWMIRPVGQAARTQKEFVFAPQPAPLSESPIPIVLSPDGSTLVYSGGSQEGAQLFVRPLNSLKSLVLRGTLPAFDPFFSPDGRWVAFRSSGYLRKVPIEGGPVVTIATIGAQGALGGTWSSDGWIYYSFGAHIWRVRDSGGTPEAITTPDTASGEVLHYWPQVLPGAKSLLITVIIGPTSESSRIAVIPISGGPALTLVEGGGYGRYLSSGHLFYTKGNTGFVVPFDARRQVITGEPKAVIANLATGTGASAKFTAANDGTIAFVEQPEINQRTVAAVDRSGNAVPLGLPVRDVLGVTVSPGDKRIAINVRQDSLRNLWIYDLASKAFEQLTQDGNVVAGPAVWRPDGLGITFARRAADKSELVTQDIDGLRNSRVIWSGPDHMWPGSWNADGRQLFFMRGGPVTLGDLEVIEQESAQPRPVLSTRMTEWGARISPDGAWLAYVSNATGEWQAYVQPWPGPGAARRVSIDGGTEVVWAKDGRELFYRNGTQLMAAPVSSSPAFAVGAARLLFDLPFVPGQPGLPNYDVSSDGQRFYLVQRGPDEAAIQLIRITVDWRP